MNEQFQQQDHMAQPDAAGDLKRGDTISVRLRHSSALICAGLASLLDGCVDITVAKAAPATPCDVVVTDYKDGVRRAQMAVPHRFLGAQRVLIVTDRDREWDIHTAMSAGVHGYVLQSCDPQELKVAVRAIGSGQRYLNPVLGRSFAESLSRETLTAREYEVLERMARGSCNKTIGSELGIGIGTVKSHVAAIFDKLGASTRTHAVMLATQRGLV